MIFNSILFLLLAALLPPLVLLGIIYRMDKIEQEPPALLLGLFLRGVLAMFPILVLELLADQFIDFFPWSTLVYLFLAYFVIPGFIEEGVKYRVLSRRTWNDPNFNYRFDAVVYAVFVSLGFAAVENVLYVLTNGFSTAVVRAIFSIPGHAMFGVVMGACLGTAKWMEAHRQFEQAAALRKRAFLLPAILHGLYDFLLVGFGWIFYLYFIGLVIYVVKLLKRSAREDGPVTM
ncbi:PrsW family intramembrane metalloprotease [Evtepia sp.]|uniref:PrsW family intramembrane metalloprotease n=1 Tax=Evtepia sp. TaxID=2773933 RepID=UPI003F15C5A1